jgi:hypothetical protein
MTVVIGSIVSMTPPKNSLRKRAIRIGLTRERTLAPMTKLLMCFVVSVAVVAIVPVTIVAEAETIATTSMGMDYANGQIGKKHLRKLTDGRKYFGFPQTPPPGYYGNWGFAPGGEYGDRNYMWRRSLGFWDTNSPACPFRYC